MSVLITIDLDALADNYRRCVKELRPGRVAAVVKADAYGLGLEPVARCLWNAGCKQFFVADFKEALKLRTYLPKSEIFVLNGVTEKNADKMRKLKLTPVLISISQVETWSALARGSGQNLPAIWHLDTGMCRYGV